MTAPSRLERALAPTVLAVVTICWMAWLASLTHPFPTMTYGDDLFYLSAAQRFAETGTATLNLTLEAYDNPILNMVRLGITEDPHQNILPLHFPAYAAVLGAFIALLGSPVWAVHVFHILLMLGIVGITYAFSLRLTGSRLAALVASIGVAICPVFGRYSLTTMSELFNVFLGLLCAALAARRPGKRNDLILALALTVAVLSRYSFLALAVCLLAYRARMAWLADLEGADDCDPSWRSFVLRDWKQGLALVAIIAVPIAAQLSVGTNGVLHYLNTNPPSVAPPLLTTDLEILIPRLQENLGQFADLFTNPGTEFLQEYEWFTLIGLLAIAFSLPGIRKRPLLISLISAHAAILLACLIFYDWHIHMRICMWFLPFVYVFAVTAAWVPRTWPRRVVGALPVLLLVLLSFSETRALLEEEIPVRQMAGRIRHASALEALNLIETTGPDAELVVIPFPLTGLAMLDVDRVYYYIVNKEADWPTTYDTLHAIDALPDLIVANAPMMISMATAGPDRWLGAYRIRVRPSGKGAPWTILDKQPAESAPKRE